MSDFSTQLDLLRNRALSPAGANDPELNPDERLSLLLALATGDASPKKDVSLIPADLSSSTTEVTYDVSAQQDPDQDVYGFRVFVKKATSAEGVLLRIDGYESQIGQAVGDTFDFKLSRDLRVNKDSPIEIVLPATAGVGDNEVSIVTYNIRQ